MSIYKGLENMKASSLIAALFFSCSSALLGGQLFQLGNVKFKTDNQFYQFANVIRCASYKKNTEEVPAAICCHYAKIRTDKFYFTGSNWTCPKEQGQPGLLSQNCDTSELSNTQTAKDYDSVNTPVSMIHFCTKMQQ